MTVSFKPYAIFGKMEMGYLYFFKRCDRTKIKEMHSFTAKPYFQENCIAAMSAICKKFEMSFQLDKWSIKYKTFPSCQCLLEIQAFCATCLHIQLSFKNILNGYKIFNPLNEQRYVNNNITPMEMIENIRRYINLHIFSILMNFMVYVVIYNLP